MLLFYTTYYCIYIVFVKLENKTLYLIKINLSDQIMTEQNVVFTTKSWHFVNNKLNQNN